MKIIKDDGNLLVFRNLSSFIIITLVGILFAGIPIIFYKTIPVWVMIIFGVCGLFAVFAAYIRTVSVDKTNKKITISNRFIWRKTQFEYPFSDIKAVETVPKTGSKGSVDYVLCLVLNTGEEVEINPQGARGGGTRLNGIPLGKRGPPDKDVGQKMAEYIGVPFNERRLPTFGETINAVKEAVIEQQSKKETEERYKVK